MDKDSILKSIKKFVIGDNSSSEPIVNVYNKYTPGQTYPEKYTKATADKAAPLYLKQIDDSMKILRTTTNPDTFFYRFGFTMQRVVELQRMGNLVKLPNNISAEKMRKDFEDAKSETIDNFLISCNTVTCMKLNDMADIKLKQKTIKKFQEQFIPYYSEMDNKNISCLEMLVDDMKRIYLK